MKTRMFVYLIVVLALVAMLFGAACRGREEVPAPQATQPASAQPTPPAPAGKQPTPAGTRLPGGTGQNDLVASGASVTTTANPGEVRVVTGARNIGTGTISSSFTIRWYPHEKSDVVGCSWDVPARDVTGRDAEVNCTYTYRERGEMHWRVVVDADNDVLETNENNNERTGTVTISGGGTPSPAGGTTAYDLYVRRMDFSPAEPTVGETITLYIMIATDTYPSQGPLFPASHLRWRKGPSFAWQEESCPANTMYVTCTPKVTFSYSQPGEYYVEVEADSRKEVAETNENNNTKGWTIVVKPQSGGQTQPPSAPTNCTARAATAGAVTIEWQFSSSADGFRIYQGTTSLEKTVGASTRNTTIMNLRLGVQYHFDVRAYNASGESRVDACSVDVTSR